MLNSIKRDWLANIRGDLLAGSLLLPVSILKLVCTRHSVSRSSSLLLVVVQV